MDDPLTGGMCVSPSVSLDVSSEDSTTSLKSERLDYLENDVKTKCEA